MRLSLHRHGLPIAILCVASALGCHPALTSTMRVETNSAAVSNITRYQTYSHATAGSAPAGYTATRFTPEVLEKVRARIDIEMTKLGYTFVAEGGDLVVRTSAGVRERLEEPTGRAAISGAPERQQQVGSLVIDIFDRKNGGHLFHGYARDEIHTKTATDDQINAAVTAILAPVPSRASSVD